MWENSSPRPPPPQPTQRYWVLMPGASNYYLTQKKGVYIRLMLLRILSRRDHPGLSDWALNAVMCILLRGRFYVTHRVGGGT